MGDDAAEVDSPADVGGYTMNKVDLFANLRPEPLDHQHENLNVSADDYHHNDDDDNNDSVTKLY